MDIFDVLVVFIIIITLVYALVKQVQDTKNIKGKNIDSKSRETIKRKLGIMNVALLGVIIFYLLNILIRFSIIPGENTLSNVAAIGAFASFLIYIWARVGMNQKNYEIRKLEK